MNSKFFKNGIIKIEVKLFNSEQFLNILWNSGIRIHNIKKIDKSTIIMEINYEDYNAVKEVVKKIQGKVSIISSKGGIFFLGRVKRKVGIVIGFFSFIIFLYVLSNFIWSIDIQTKMYISPYEIRAQLKELGVLEGVSKSSIDVYELEEKLQNLNSDIMWSNIRVEGSTLKVTIEEKITPPLEVEKDTDLGVVAKMDGEVKRIYTTSGTAAVKAGDVVKAGDILVYPYEGTGEYQYDVVARGSVLANTFYEKVIELQISGEKIYRTGNMDSEIYIKIADKKIYLKKSTKNFNNYDKIEEDGKYIHKNIYYEKKSSSIEETEEEIVNEAVERLYNSTKKEITRKAQIVDKIISKESIENGKILLKVLFVVEQDIASN
ncbi:sporulation protein YqfD [Sarcina ventriculi]|uniref:sporulation protein YqfD n=1 Tax=Sarcina ventriculi TaxID=1267 RepID=UPI00073F6360|nr:sporulation protein YqfD [Sarcina ventriculi]